MGMESFPLQDSGTLSSATGRLIRAGWRWGGLYVPPRLWKEGENSVSLTLRRSSGDEGKPVLVRNASMELLFLPTPVRPAAPVPGQVPATTPDSNILSNGSQYSAPSSLYRTTIPQALPKVTEPSPAGS
jgi:hypothetical protein